MMRCHDKHETGSEAKARAVLQSAFFTNPRFAPRKGLYVTLVGSGAGLARHIGEARQHGFNVTQVHTVERDPKTFRGLRAAIDKVGMPISWAHDDVFENVRRLRRGVVGHLDLDMVERMSRALITRTSRLVRDKGIKTFSVTVTTRQDGVERDLIGKSLGIPKTLNGSRKVSWKTKTKGKRTILRRRHPEAARTLARAFKRKLPGYLFEAVSYRGVGHTPMLMVIGRKRRVE